MLPAAILAAILPHADAFPVRPTSLCSADWAPLALAVWLGLIVLVSFSTLLVRRRRSSGAAPGSDSAVHQGPSLSWRPIADLSSVSFTYATPFLLDSATHSPPPGWWDRHRMTCACVLGGYPCRRLLTRFVIGLPSPRRRFVLLLTLCESCAIGVCNCVCAGCSIPGPPGAAWEGGHTEMLLLAPRLARRGSNRRHSSLWLPRWILFSGVPMPDLAEGSDFEVSDDEGVLAPLRPPHMVSGTSPVWSNLMTGFHRTAQDALRSYWFLPYHTLVWHPVHRRPVDYFPDSPDDPTSPASRRARRPLRS